MNKKDFGTITETIIDFRDQRNWKQFHTIKDLLLGLNIEVSELQELVLWKNEKEIDSIGKENIEDELADIFIYLTYIATHFNIDLLSAVDAKIGKNGKKYPVDKSYGSNKKYTELE